jgi:primosomal protein N''
LLLLGLAATTAAAAAAATTTTKLNIFKRILFDKHVTFFSFYLGVKLKSLLSIE